jgi:hypothetical protein
MTAVQAHSRVSMTNDLAHSNQVVQHIMDMALAAEIDADPQLSHVHMLSDGCAKFVVKADGRFGG